MGQFRTTADILDLALQNAGEVTNGNSSYEAQLLNYLNRVHMAIVSGGTIPLGKDATVEIDEVWPWAQAKRPLHLELQPKYTTGNIHVRNGNWLATLSSAPAFSMLGWHLKVDGSSQWYRISDHDASSVTINFDSDYLEEENTSASFTAAKLDYDLVPDYIVIDTFNNKLQWQEVAGTTITATIGAGAYTIAQLCTEVETALNFNGGAPTYTVTYSAVTRKFTIASNRSGGAVFVLVGAGDQSEFSIHKTLGFDDENTTNAASVTSTYPLGGISRLIEPFRIDKAPGGRITAVDQESFMRDYPLQAITEGQPTRFTVIREDSDGFMRVRFNAYPREATRVEIDHVPVPRDLKDSSSSIPLIPRKHSDVLEDAATFYLMLCKSDDRAQVYANLMQGKLKAMIAQHRGSLVRSGEHFGQIISRRDLIPRAKGPFFGDPY